MHNKLRLFAVLLRNTLHDEAANNCKTIPFKVTIKPAGCDPITYENNYCTGFCTSFFIPGQGRSKSFPNKELCKICKPVHVYLKNITLDCVKETNNKFPVLKYKRMKAVPIINKCECEECYMDN